MNQFFRRVVLLANLLTDYILLPLYFVLRKGRFKIDVVKEVCCQFQMFCHDPAVERCQFFAGEGIQSPTDRIDFFGYLQG